MTQMPQGLVRWIGVWILALTTGSCTAWQYEILTCDPAASVDICNRLNTEDGINPTTACDGIWRCDQVTNTCQPSVRDQDRDGDLPIACGGTDCDDLDPQLNGLRKTCDCKQLLDPPTSCSVGTGACQNKGLWTCQGSTPKCDAVAGSPPNPPGWNTTQVSPTNPTWDWNCDGIIEESCTTTANQAGPKVPCAISHCPDETKNRVLAEMGKPSPNIDNICDQYCQSNAEPGKCKDAANVNTQFFINCFGSGDSPSDPDAQCGKLIIACKCTNFFGCFRELGSPKGGYVFCR